MAAKKILLIDDDSTVARFVTFRLSQKGYSVFHASNGLDGLQMVRTVQPDCLVLDMMMPGMDGREVAEQLAEYNLFDISKIIVLTGKDDFSETKALFDLGVADYMQKPFNVNELIIRIERLLQSSAKKN